MSILCSTYILCLIKVIVLHVPMSNHPYHLISSHNNNNNNNIYLKSNIHSIIRYKFSGLYNGIKHGIHIRLYNVYKEFTEIISTQLCNINCPNI